MTLTKTRNGDSPLIDQVFDTFFDMQLPRFTYSGAPIDLWDENGKYFLEMPVPGFDAKDINVEVSGNTVAIYGTFNEKPEKREFRYHRREMRHGSFSRSVTLPQDLDANTVVATIEKGILRLELTPLKPLTPKKIAVKAIGV